jgi:hypothetical protein
MRMLHMWLKWPVCGAREDAPAESVAGMIARRAVAVLPVRVG